MKYSTLAQQNPGYMGAIWHELGLLYRGGHELTDAAAREFLPRYLEELPSRYDERLRFAVYTPYMGQIVDYYSSALFSHQLTVTAEAGGPDAAVYERFEANADGKGRGIARLMRDVFTTSLVCGKGLVGVDFPASSGVATSRAEEEALGAGLPYAYEIDPKQLIDWEHDDDGTFRWCVLHRLVVSRDSPEDDRDGYVEEFKVWRRVDGVVSWELYRTARRDRGGSFSAREEVQLVDAGTTSFVCIPIVELSIPDGLWIGNKLGSLAKEHFRRRSALAAAEQKSLFAVPYVKLGPEIHGVGDSLPSEAQQNPHRGDDPRLQLINRGYMVLGNEDDIGFAEPVGSAFALVDQQCKELVDEMFRVVHQMAFSVSATTSSMQRSGVSKVEDRRATETVLQAYGQLVRECAKGVYTTISDARGEVVEWQPEGLDSFKMWDRAELVREGIAVDSVGIPSATFKHMYKSQIALRLLGDVPPETADQIRTEIQESPPDVTAPSVAEQVRKDYEAGLITRQTAIERIGAFYGIEQPESYAAELDAERHAMTPPSDLFGGLLGPSETPAAE